MLYSRKSIFITISFLFFSVISFAQLTEDFDDEDLSTPIIWSFAASTWQTNTDGRLQSLSNIANSAFYISAPVILQAAQQWQFKVELSFNPSSSNYVDVYLQTDSVDVTKPTCAGYFVRIGNTQDEISLYRKNADNTILKLIDGQDGTLNKSDNKLWIKITRKADYTWTLWRDSTATGTQWQVEGRAMDNTYADGNYFGIAVHQSTNSFFQKHFFDDIALTPYVPDVTPPTINNIEVKQAHQININFSEPIDKSSVHKNLFDIPSVSIDTFFFLNNNTIQLQLFAPLTSKASYQLILKNIADVEGNILSNYTTPIIWNNSEKYDVLITEIMADPDPIVQLPNAEYIEIYNRTGFPFNLDGWKLSIGSSTTTLKNIIPAYSYAVICSQSNTTLFPNTINTIGVTSFPSLNNTGDTITLYNSSNNIIHSVYYNDAMHENSVKQNGGWSLELKDTTKYCVINGNWTSSSNSQGGTPGKPNSVYQTNTILDALKIVRCVSLSPTQLQLTFNHPTDSVSLTQLNHYTIDGGAYKINMVQVLAPLYQTAVLQLSAPLQESKPIILHVSGIQRCDGLVMADQTIQTGVGSIAQSGDIIFNEILFNPKTGGSDFIELYNRSNKIIDCSDLFLSNSLQLGSSIYKISNQPLLLFPQEYIACTEDKNALIKQYWIKDLDHIIQSSTLPSFPDDKGTVILTNKQGLTIDSLTYSEKWHFPLLHDVEGVSLERTRFNGNTNDLSNWHSTASTAGYATPGYINSELADGTTNTSRFQVSPKTFSPNQDGFEDYTIINYQMEQPGAVANITVFDLQGRIVKTIARNATLGNSGQFKWDGTTDNFTLVGQGAYIIYCDAFTLNSKHWKEKLTVVVVQAK